MKLYKINEAEYLLKLETDNKAVRITPTDCIMEIWVDTGIKSYTIDSEIYSFIENTKRANPSDMVIMTYALIEVGVGLFIFGEE